MTEGKALKTEGTKYYDQLRDQLDLILTFTELGSSIIDEAAVHLLKPIGRDMRANIPLRRPAGPSRDSDNCILLAYILVDRISRHAVDGGYGPSEG